jgi:hypothetical protein
MSFENPIIKFNEGLGSIVYGSPSGAAGGGGGPAFVGARNGTSLDAAGFVVLGNELNDPLQPAKLLDNREIDCNGNNLYFTLGTFAADSVAVYISPPFLQINGNQGTVGAGNLVVTEGSDPTVSSTLSAITLQLAGNINNFGAGEVSIKEVADPAIETVLRAATLQLIGDTNNAFAASVVIQDIAGPVFSMIAGLTFVQMGFSPYLWMESVRNQAIYVGPNNVVPTALMHFDPGTHLPHSAPIKLSAGVLLTGPEDGAIEYNGANLFFTVGAARGSMFVGNSGAAAPALTAGPVFTSFFGGNTDALGNPNSWASVVIGGTTYKIPLYT